jgi:pyruvate,water dikinase
MPEQPRFLSWQEAFHAGHSRCGGKGWNLSRPHRYGFNVPVGGVLTVEGYAQILGSAAIASSLNALQEVSAPDAVTADLVAALDSLRTQIELMEFPLGLAAELEQFLSRLGLQDTPLAIRSSATAEDGSAASFAGMHRSFLNVTGAGLIGRAVLGCYASLWTPHALAYRRRMGFRDEDVGCAVALCAMVTRPHCKEPESA